MVHHRPNLERLRQLTENMTPARDDIARIAIELLADGVFACDEEGTIFYVSALFLDMFGYEKEEDLIGKSVEYLLPDELKTAHVDWRKSFIQESKLRRMSEGKPLHVKSKLDEELVLQIGLANVPLGDGRQGVLGIVKRLNQHVSQGA